MAKKEPGKLVGGVYTLFEPLDLSGGKITEVPVHPLKARDMIDAEKELNALTERDFSQAGSFERQICLIARMIRLPQADALELGSADIVGLQAFL